MSGSSFQITPAVLLLGVIVGLAYASLAMGLVLTYKSSRVVNFAHGEVGALAAALLAWLVNDHKVAFWTALVAMMALAAVMGMGAERLVVRRLSQAPRVIVLVATLGLAQLFLFGTLLTTSRIKNKGPGFPMPFKFQFEVGPLVLNASHLLIIILVPVSALVLAAFFKFTKLGTAVRASAENADSARLSGISVNRVSSLVWALAAVLSAITGVLLGPGKALLATESMGPGLMVRALAAAVFARMVSLPKAFIAGVGIGVIEQVIFFNRPLSGQVELALFFVVIAGLLMQAREGVRKEEASSWSFTSVSRALPRELAESLWAKSQGWVLGLGALALGAAAPVFLSNSQTFLATTVLVFAMVALSVTVLTGYAGQISLGQFAFVGLGAAFSYQLSANFHFPFPLAVASAALLGGLISGLVGIPALRVKGLHLAVATLALALVTQSWLMGQTWMAGSGVIAARPAVGGFSFDTQKRYYFLVLAVLALTVLGVRNLTRSGIGRRMVAVRDNEVGASSFALSPVRAKITGFAIAGTLAALAGALYGHCLQRFSPGTFPATESLRVVAIAVIGGLGSVPGAIAGAGIVVGLERLVKVAYLGLLTTSVGLLALLLFVPRGLAGIGAGFRDRLLDLVGARKLKALEEREEVEFERAVAAEVAGSALSSTVIVQEEERQERQAKAAHKPVIRASAPDAPFVLEGHGINLHFGGVVALDDVSISVHTGEVLGIIGPNGAGKTTLFDVICGHTEPQSGRLLFNRGDITDLAPHERAHLGLVRSFQDARLFPGLTVLDTVRLAQERHRMTRIIPALLSLPSSRVAEKEKMDKADGLIEMMGLVAFRDRLAAELSTGTRRILDMACMLALEPSLLLLDEPSAGIAQKEVEALGELLISIRKRTNTTMVIIEHDIPLVSGLSDRLMAMESGKVICVGDPKSVLAHPQVVAAYLGSSQEMVQRSGTAVRPKTTQKKARVTQAKQEEEAPKARKPRAAAAQATSAPEIRKPKAGKEEAPKARKPRTGGG